MNIKKISATVIAAFAVAVSVTMTGNAASARNFDYKYEVLDDGTLSITDYIGRGGDVVIPSEIDGKKVTTIGSNAFMDTQNLAGDVLNKITSLTIPEGITTIKFAAFQTDCIPQITIPDSVTLIENSAFRGGGIAEINVGENNKNYSSVDGVLFSKDKAKLIAYPGGKTTKSYEIPNGVTSIGESSFNGAKNTTSITIPNSVTTIEDGAFFNSKGITSITIPNSVTTIGSSAFGFTNITKIDIPASVTAIGDSCFSGSNLVQITVDPNNKNYSSSDGILFNKDKTKIIKYPGGKTDKTYTIPNGVKRIADSAFMGNDFIMSVTIPSSVYSIGKAAFSSCDKLTSATIYSRDFGYYYGGFANPFPHGSNFTIFGYKNTSVEKYLKNSGSNNNFIALDAELKNGDANGDGRIGLNDAIVVVNHIAGNILLAGNAFKNGDLNGDGKISLDDAVQLVKMIANS